MRVSLKKIKNFKLNNYAVSDKNISLKLNVTANPTVSSIQNFLKILIKLGQDIPRLIAGY